MSKVQTGIVDTGYVFIIDCTNSNTGGTADGTGNKPKTFEKKGETFGEITDLTIKRGLRDFVLNEYQGKLGMGIHVQSGKALSTVVEEVCGKPELDTDQKRRDEACRSLWDVRTFGGILFSKSKADKAEDQDSVSESEVEPEGETKTKNKKKASSGGNLDFSIPVTGAVVVRRASSLDPVDVVEETLTRCAPAKENGKDHNWGTHSFIRYARYRGEARIESFLAKRNGFTIDDQVVLEDGLKDIYKYRVSRGRPSVQTVAVYKITPKVTESQGVNSMAIQEAQQKLQCTKSSTYNPEFPPTDASDYVLPEPFENEFVVVTRIK